MILADDILASAGGRDDLYALGGFSKMVPALRRAPKFVLSRQAVAAVHSVSSSSPKSIMSARSFARPPFPTAYRRRATEMHPDNGGSKDGFARLTDARDKALAERRVRG